MPTWKTVLFDLDGTLIDHFNVIFRCYEYALSSLGLTVPSREVIRATIGASVEVTMSHFAPPHLHGEAVRLHREQFQRIFLDDLTALEGALWILKALKLKGVRTAILTNKQGPGSRAIADHLGFSPYLDGVFGVLDTPYRKPQLEFTWHALKSIGATADGACMVGDSPFDIETARAVKMPCYCLTTGTHSRDQLLAAGAEQVFDNLIELGCSEFRLTRP